MFCLSPLDPGRQCIFGKNWKGILGLNTPNISASCDNAAYSFLTLFLFPRRYFLLTFLTPLFDPLLFILIPLSTHVGVAKNFILCLLSCYTFFPGDLVYYLAFSYSLNSKICIPAQISYLRSRHLYPTDYWTCQQLFNCLLCFQPFQFSIHSSHLWELFDPLCYT